MEVMVELLHHLIDLLKIEFKKIERLTLSFAIIRFCTLETWEKKSPLGMPNMVLTIIMGYLIPVLLSESLSSTVFIQIVRFFHCFSPNISFLGDLIYSMKL